jgi:hypothetical protein
MTIHRIPRTTAPEPGEYVPMSMDPAMAPAERGKTARPTSQRFVKWDACAAIRTKPRQRLRPPGDNGKEYAYFSPDLVPLIAHPLVHERGLGREVTIQHLYRYLHFTAVLEQQLVNPVLLRIATDGYPFELPKSMILDAHRIYCDEGYHALCAVDLTHQIEERTGSAALDQTHPQAFRDLATLVAGVPESQRHLLELAFIIVSETLVSAILTKSHLDVRVEPAIRQVILEHAQDEAVHSAYFSDLARLAWPQLTPEVRSMIGQHLPQLIIAFLSPDLPHLTRVLTALGYTGEECRRMLGEAMPRHEVLSGIRNACAVTVGLFRTLGAMQDPATAAAFRSSGLFNI